MTCNTPNTKQLNPVAETQPIAVLDFGFLIGDVVGLRDWSARNNVTVAIYKDPIYDMFTSDPQLYSGETITIKVSSKTRYLMNPASIVQSFLMTGSCEAVLCVDHCLCKSAIFNLSTSYNHTTYLNSQTLGCFTAEMHDIDTNNTAKHTRYT